MSNDTERMEEKYDFSQPHLCSKETLIKRILELERNRDEEIEALQSELSRIKEGVKGLPKYGYGKGFRFMHNNTSFYDSADLDNLMENK